MPNGIDLGPNIFTQWRTQQGGSVLPPRDIHVGQTLMLSAISYIRSGYKLMRLYYRQLLATSRLVPSGISRALYFPRYRETQLGKICHGCNYGFFAGLQSHVRVLSVPNGIDLGLTVFTQWRTQFYRLWT